MPISNSNLLPNGSTVTFEEEGHRYTIDGLEATSTTTVVGSWWPEVPMSPNAAPAAARGTRIHYAIQQGIEGKPFVGTAETQPYYEWAKEFAQDWREMYPGVEIYTEMLLGNADLGICGTADLVIHYENKWLIFDWKTGRSRWMGRRYGLPSGPARKLLDSNKVKYGLQTRLYEKLLRDSGYVKDSEEVYEEVIYLSDMNGKVNVEPIDYTEADDTELRQVLSEGLLV